MQNNTQDSWEEIRIDCVEDLIEAGFVEQTANEAFVALKPIISSLLSKQAEEISEAVEGLVVLMPEEVAKLNIYLPNIMQEQAYYEAIGYQKAISDTLLAIKQVTK